MKKNQNAFTLIELLIVLAIVGILAAIAIPQFMHYKEEAIKENAKQEVSVKDVEEGNSEANNKTSDLIRVK